MSKSKKDQLFPGRVGAIPAENLAKMLATALRKDFGDSASSVKRIGQLTNANLRAIKNWYEARNTPCSSNLLLLARSSPSTLKLILEEIGGEYLLGAEKLLFQHGVIIQTDLQGINFTNNSGGENVTINVTIKPENSRQLWFLALLRSDSQASAKDITANFSVTIRTARRDIVGLKNIGKIKFVNSKKNGRYQITGK